MTEPLHSWTNLFLWPEAHTAYRIANRQSFTVFVEICLGPRNKKTHSKSFILLCWVLMLPATVWECALNWGYRKFDCCSREFRDNFCTSTVLFHGFVVTHSEFPFLSLIFLPTACFLQVLPVRGGIRRPQPRDKTTSVSERACVPLAGISECLSYLTLRQSSKATGVQIGE